MVEVDDSIALGTVPSEAAKREGDLTQQRTPARVAHRRADPVRERRVVDIECLGIENSLFRIEVVGEGGLYIKELVSGDGGRTTPSLAEILAVPAKVVALDVVQVDGINNGDE